MRLVELASVLFEFSVRDVRGARSALLSTGRRFIAEFAVPAGESLYIDLHDGLVRVESQVDKGPDITVQADRETLVGLFTGQLTLTEAWATGHLTMPGLQRMRSEFMDFFPLIRIGQEAMKGDRAYDPNV